MVRVSRLWLQIYRYVLPAKYIITRYFNPGYSPIYTGTRCLPNTVSHTIVTQSATHWISPPPPHTLMCLLCIFPLADWCFIIPFFLTELSAWLYSHEIVREAMNDMTMSITLMWNDVPAGKCYNVNIFTSLFRFLWAACRRGSEGTSRDADVISIFVSFATLQHVYSTISHLVTSSRSR